MRALELRVPPPLVAVLVGTAMWFAAQQRVSLELPLVVRVVAFVVLALAGGATALAGNLAFKRARTTINHRFTRNPMYVGLTLLLLGWAAFLCSAWALLGPVIFVLYISRFQIAPEERVLSAKFGAAYTEYTARVRRWL